jgi:hypothetical protein
MAFFIVTAVETSNPGLTWSPNTVSVWVYWSCKSEEISEGVHRGGRSERQCQTREDSQQCPLGKWRQLQPHWFQIFYKIAASGPSAKRKTCNTTPVQFMFADVSRELGEVLDAKLYFIFTAKVNRKCVQSTVKGTVLMSTSLDKLWRKAKRSEWKFRKVNEGNGRKIWGFHEANARFVR